MTEISKSPFSSPRLIFPMALGATFLWGCAYPAVKLGYAAFGVDTGSLPALYTFAGTRFFLAGIAVLLLCALFRRSFPAPHKEDLPGILSLALVQTFGQYAFYYVGLAHTTGVRASILNSAASFLTVLVSGALWPKRDGITARKLLGCVLGLGGVILVNLGGTVGEAPFCFQGEGMILLASLTCVGGSIASKVTTQGRDPMLITGWQLALGGGILLTAGRLGGGTLTPVTPSAPWLMAFMVFISAVAFTLWTVMLKYHPVSKVAVYNFLTPVFGALLSGLMLSESLLSPATLGALLLVVCGILLVNIAPSQNPFCAVKK